MSMPDSIPEEMLSAYLDGELSSKEHDDVERALEDNAELRILLADLERIRTEIRKLPRHELSVDFAQRVTRAAVASAKTSGRAVTPVAPSTIPSSTVPRPRTYASRVRMVIGTIVTAAAIFIAISALPPQDPQVARKEVAMNNESPSGPEANAPNAADDDSRALVESGSVFEAGDDFAANKNDTFTNEADRFSFGDDSHRFENERLQRSPNRGRDSPNAISTRSRFHNRSTESDEPGAGGGLGGLGGGVPDWPIEDSGEDTIEFAADAQPENVRAEQTLLDAQPEVAATAEAAFAPSNRRLNALNLKSQSQKTVDQETLRLSSAAPQTPQAFDAVLYVSLNPQETAEVLNKNKQGLRMVPLRQDVESAAEKKQTPAQLSDAETLRELAAKRESVELFGFSESRLSELNVPKNAELIAIEGSAADVLAKVQQLGPRLDAGRSELNLLSSKASLILKLNSGGREQAKSASSMARTPAAAPKASSSARSFMQARQVDTAAASNAAAGSVNPQPSGASQSKAKRPNEQQSKDKETLPNDYLRVLLIVQPDQ